MQSLTDNPNEMETNVNCLNGVPSLFTSTCSHLDINDQPYVVHILKMPASTMLFVNELAKYQGIDEMAVAMQMPTSKELLGTTIFSKAITSQSQSLAEKLSKRYHRQFFVSCNVQADRLVMPILERKLFDYIQSNQSQIV